MQAFRRRRAGAGGFEGEQIGDGARGGRKFEVGSVDNFRSERAAASYVNGLGAVMRFVTAGAAGGSGLGAAKVFGARQFVAGIIDHFIGLYLGWGVGAKLGNLLRE